VLVLDCNSFVTLWDGEDVMQHDLVTSEDVDPQRAPPLMRRPFGGNARRYFMLKCFKGGMRYVQ